MGGPRRSIPALACVAVLLVAACQPAAPTGPTIPPDATQSLVSTASTDAPTATAPARTPVPGFESWATINPQAVQVSVDRGTLVMNLIGRVLWFNTERGVLFHEAVTGDFRATATVRTSKASDPSAPPGADGTIQLAGLMARTEIPAENYVFIVTGSIGNSTGVESKTTTSSQSVYIQRGSNSEGDADLRLCRRGPTFLLAWRAVGSTDAWTPMATFDRPDMPQTLQVGANIYTDSVPDLVARFEGLTIDPLRAGDAC